MKQQKFATMVTVVVFLACAIFVYMFFNRAKPSETITTECYFADSLVKPQVDVKSDICSMNVIATQGTELTVEITNKTSSTLELDEYSFIYRVSTDGNRMKTDESYYKVPITRGYGSYEIVKKIPPYETKNVVFDCTNLGGISPGSYIIKIYNNLLFFTLERNPEA